MGEEKRRREAGEYPTEGGDPGYERFSAKLRQLYPKLEERDIGLSWMRANNPNPEIPYGRPEDVPLRPGHVLIHVLASSGSVYGAVPVERIDETVAFWQGSGLSREATRQGIFDKIMQNRHQEGDTGNALVMAACWLAFTSEAAPALRTLAAQGFLRITYTVETYLHDGGRRALNFRLAATDQRDGPPVSIPLSDMAPTVRPERRP